MKMTEFRIWVNRFSPVCGSTIFAHNILLLSMDLWTSGATSSCPGSYPKATCSECRVSHVANDKGGNEMILGAVHRFPGIFCMAEENPGKPQLRNRPMKGLCEQSSPQMGSLSSK
jgi:hypothetical protein